MLPMLLPMLTNVVGGLCADAATNLAKEHVMDMVDKVVPPEAMEMIDQMVSSDPTNPCSSMGELIDCMCDPDNDAVPAMPAMPSMEELPHMCNDMMAGALANEGMQWANSMCETASSMMDVSIDCRIKLDSTGQISVERL